MITFDRYIRGDMSTSTKPTIENVRDFWSTEACGTHFVRSYADKKDFYAKFREYRYRTEWHIPLLVPFADGRGKTVLEIGIGNGADGAMWAMNGAVYTGVDLTDAALEATCNHFEVLGLPGTFRKGNAEQLDFPDASFDIVYSHGVLMCTPNMQAALEEIHRVLKPNGRVIVMLYHKHSFNYYVRIMTVMRLRVLACILMRVGHWRTDRETAKSRALVGLRGNESRKVWEIHYHNFLRQGWSYLRPANFVHHCTDGPECPLAFAYTRSEARRFFSRFHDIQMKVAHFPLRRYCRWFPFALEKILAPKVGWYLFIYGTR
ncbi:MAG: hypothetical protein DME23_21425 [Verrucomicrobia bacterium]|nr:MAG: hypothetical protein DME23_21425 [Verrucomicrobiota bacterium]